MSSAGRVCAVLFLASLLAPCPRAWAGKPEADRYCERAARAESDAQDFERKSEQRKRFLSGNGAAPRGGAAATGIPPAAAQSLRAQAAQARELLPQLRQGIAAAERDSAFAPGIGRYFSQLEAGISTTLQAVDACLAAPERCAAPVVQCPAPPSIPFYTQQNGSTALIRQVQESYRQSSNMAYQTCLSLKNSVSRELQGVKSSGGTGSSAAGSSGAEPAGSPDLYLVKAGNLKREVSRLRLDADRAAGVAGYCGMRPGSAAGGRGGKDGSGIPDNGKVADLKADWDAKWSGDKTLRASAVPPPASSEAAPGETVTGRVSGYLSEKGPWWWYKAKSLYREADEQVELTEFVKSRPMELLKDIATTYVEWAWGSVGKSATTGYKILEAVKTTADDVGGMLAEAPGVIVHGSATETRSLYQRADRVPLKLYNNLFDEVLGKFPPPRYGYVPEKGTGNE